MVVVHTWDVEFHDSNLEQFKVKIDRVIPFWVVHQEKNVQSLNPEGTGQSKKKFGDANFSLTLGSCLWC